MEPEPVIGTMSIKPLMPRAMLDAGGEGWSAVSEIITERLEELGSGDVIEISSLEPCHRHDILTWCGASGHDLFQMLADGDRTWFWIKKR